MQSRPFLIAAACSFVAALALVTSEAAFSGVHDHRGGTAGHAVTSGTDNANGSNPDHHSNAGGGSGFDQQAAAPNTQASDETGDQSAAGGDSSQPAQSGSGGIDLGPVTQLVPPAPAGLGH